MTQARADLTVQKLETIRASQADLPLAQYTMSVNGNTLRTEDGGATLSAQRIDGTDITDATELAQVVTDAKSAFQAFAAAFANKAVEHQNVAYLNRPTL